MPVTTILVVDDEPMVRTLVTKILTKSGYDVLEAADGREGLRMHRDRTIDLTITDIYMPVMDGMEFLRSLLADSPNVKVIVMSGGGERTFRLEETLDQARKEGARIVLAKPFTPNELRAAVQQLVGSAVQGGGVDRRRPGSDRRRGDRRQLLDRRSGERRRA